MEKSTFEIAASISSVLIFALLCVALNKPFGGVGFLIALLIFTLVISAAGLKLADFEEDG